MNLGSDSLLAKLDRLPPIICRLMAKNGGFFMSDHELMNRTGLSRHLLRRVYRAISWRKSTVEEVDMFLTACGFKWSSQRRQRWLISLRLSEGDGITRMRHLKPRNKTEAAAIKALLKHVKRLLQ